MRARVVSNDELLPKVKKPVLITHGIKDNLILPNAAIYNARLIPYSRISFYNGVGHSPFWENPIRFNYELKYFARNI